MAKRERLTNALAVCSFTIVFPAYIIYQNFVQLGLLPPFFGGYFTTATILTLPIVLYAYLMGKAHHAGIVDFLFIIFLILFLLTIGIGHHSAVSKDIIEPHTAYFIKFTALYLLSAITPWGENGFQRYCKILLLLISATVLAQIANSSFLASQAAILRDDFFLDYQGLAFAYLVIFIPATANATPLKRYAAYAISAPTLFLIGARSEFIGFFVIIASIEFSFSKIRALALLSLSFIALLTLSILASDLELEDNRMLRIFSLGTDTSALERKETINNALNTISDHPILGSYGSHEAGQYAHNILSAWVDLGLLGIALLLSMLTLIAARTLKSSIEAQSSPSHKMLMAMLWSTALLLVFAKAYTYQLIPVLIGFYLYHRTKILQRMPRECHFAV